MPLYATQGAFRTCKHFALFDHTAHFNAEFRIDILSFRTMRAILSLMRRSRPNSASRIPNSALIFVIPSNASNLIINAAQPPQFRIPHSEFRIDILSFRAMRAILSLMRRSRLNSAFRIPNSELIFCHSEQRE